MVVVESSRPQSSQIRRLYKPLHLAALNQGKYVFTNTFILSLNRKSARFMYPFALRHPQKRYISAPTPSSKAWTRSQSRRIYISLRLRPKPSRPTAAIRVIKPFMASQNAAPKPCEVKPGFVIAGFPSIGKTYLADHPKLCPGYKVLDVDLSKYSASECCEIAKEKYLSNTIVLVSANEEMRDELVKNDVPFVLVYPPRELKDVWIERLRPFDDLVNYIEQNWDAMIDSCNQQPECEKFAAPKKVYLSHMIEELAERMDKVRQCYTEKAQQDIVTPNKGASPM